MTLQRFLNAVGDSRWLWLARARWRPAPTDRFPVTIFLAQLAVVVAVASLPGAAIALTLQRLPQMRGGLWPLQDFAALGLIFGLVALTLVALAWNRRAARLRASRQSTPAAAAPLPWWWRWPLGAVYLAVLFVLTPLYLAVAIDNALGTAAWNKYRAQLIARGEAVSLTQLVGSAPSDPENAAQSPLLKPLGDFRISVTNGQTEFAWNDPAGRLRLDAILNLPSRNEGSPDPRGTNSGRMALDPYARGIRAQGSYLDPELVLAARHQLGLPTNVPPASPGFIPLPPELVQRYALQSTNRSLMSNEELSALVIQDPAAEVLAHLKRVDPELQELATAVARPRARFTAGWNEGLPPHTHVSLLTPTYGKMKALSVLFRVRGTARLQKGDAQGALADARTLFQVSHLLSEDPTLIALLVRLAQESIALSLVREGLAERAWNDAQLAELQALLRPIDRREALAYAYRGERLLGIDTMEYWIHSSPRSTQYPSVRGADVVVDSAVDAPRPPLPFLQPRGMFRRFQIAQSQLVDQMIADLAAPDWPRSLARAETADPLDTLRRAGLVPATRNTMLAVQLAPAFDRVSAKIARLNTTARLAEVACGLERHRLRHGRFPETLEALVPGALAALPSDPMSGQPFHYQRTDDGWFKLWSVGLDGRDDGGSRKRTASDAKDWVWPGPGPIAKDELKLL